MKETKKTKETKKGEKAQKLKSCIQLLLQITVTDKDGKVVHKTPIRASKSFVLAFLQILETQMLQSATTIKDNAGVNRSCAIIASNFGSKGSAGSTFMGIVVGTGTTTPANDDFQMETLIAHGSGAGQLNYAAQSDISAQEVGGNVDYQLLRSFQNLSGSTINVTEAGLHSAITGTEIALTIHDVVTAVPVANGQTITVTYTLRTTV